MVTTPEKSSHTILGVALSLVLILTALSVYGYLKIRSLENELTSQRTAFEESRTLIATKEERILNLESMIEVLKREYSLLEEDGAELLDLLNREKNKNDEFEDQIDDISGTVGKLNKLSKLDPELLMKYSRVYFLNEHYTPAKVAEIPSEFRFKKDEPEYIDAKVLPSLRDLLEDAQADGINLLVVSGYRSFDEQRGLKGAYTTMYGTGANAFSADQGYSEHQLGTTLDFTTTEIGGGLTGFETTTAYAWLEKNGYKYGFVLSYPKNNTYYIFEPWHWRFVGEKLADDLNDDGKYFYDLDQREIDKYLISIFD